MNKKMFIKLNNQYLQLADILIVEQLLCFMELHCDVFTKNIMYLSIE